PQRPQPLSTRQTTADLMKHDFAEALVLQQIVSSSPHDNSCVFVNSVEYEIGCDTAFSAPKSMAGPSRPLAPYRPILIFRDSSRRLLGAF
ncbi:MAG: hypothetical protein K2X97_21580, partial [Mycobacteriaceae bacterium]|nr:hypothetical protein [Mycobacteriaceae bacterium]